MHRLRTVVATTLSLFCTCAAAELVVIVHPSATPPSRAQVANAYLGRSAALSPFDQPESVALREEFYRNVVEREPEHVKAVWAKLLFTGRGRPPRQLPDSAAVRDAVAADPRAIGYVDRSFVDASVRVVPLR